MQIGPGHVKFARIMLGGTFVTYTQKVNIYTFLLNYASLENNVVHLQYEVQYPVRDPGRADTVICACVAGPCTRLL